MIRVAVPSGPTGRRRAGEIVLRSLWDIEYDIVSIQGDVNELINYARLGEKERDALAVLRERLETARGILHELQGR